MTVNQELFWELASVLSVFGVVILILQFLPGDNNDKD